MKMRQTMIVVLAVVMVSLFAIVATAATLVVISEHSTDTDFEGDNIDVDNMTVDGTGDSATVGVVPTSEGETVSLTQDSSSPRTPKSGLVFEPNVNMSAIEIREDNDADTWWLIDHETGETLETGNAGDIGDWLTIERKFVEGEQYRIVFANSDDESHARRVMEESTPVETEHLDVVHGFEDGEERDNPRNIDRLVPTIGGDESSYVAVHDVGVEEISQGVIDVDAIGDASVTATYQVPDGNGGWEDVTSTSISSTGETVVDLSSADAPEYRLVIEAENTGPDGEIWTFDVARESLDGERSSPEVVSVSPEEGETITDTEVDLVVDVTDDDFEEEWGDEVTVTFYGNGEQVHQKTVHENGEVSAAWDTLESGDNEWYATVEDEHGLTDSTETRSFETPAELEIYDETEPDELVETVDVTVTFFGEDEEVISETTNDGTVDLSGLPLDQELTVQVEANDYITRQTIIRSITEQQEVFILPETADTVSSRFEIRDPTGQIQQANSRILIKKPISRDEGTVWHTVVADEMGAGGFSTVLEQDRRYKIEIEDLQNGEIREMGPYIATESETVILDVDELEYEFEDEGAGYRWNATWLDEDDPAIDFVFDADHGIVQLDLTIVERGGNETVVSEETWTDVGSVQHKAVIPEEVSNINTSSYNVEWEATIVDSNGEEVTVSGSSVAGPRTSVSPDGVSDRVLSVVGVFLILMVAGLFSYANVGVGGVVTSLFAGLLWFVGILPGAVSGMAIGLALIVSVLWMARMARGPY